MSTSTTLIITSSPISTSTTTTTTTTTQAAYVFQGSFSINVTNANEFVQEPNVEEVLTRAIAEWAEVNESYVHNVEISLAPARRLSLVHYGLDNLLLSLRNRKLQSDFSMQTQSGVSVTFDIIIPPDGSETEVVATIVVERFEKKGLQEATELINTVIRSGALGNEYEAKVTTKVIKLTQEPAPVVEKTTPAKKDDSAAMVTMVIVAACVGLLLILLTGAAHAYRKVLKKRYISVSRHNKLDDEFVEKAGPMGSVELYELLFPPPVIEESQRRALWQLVQVTNVDEAFHGDVEQASDLVVITYNTGQRVDDAPGAGPGLYYAAAVCRVFYEHGLQCYMFLLGAEDRTLELLSKSHARCRLLVALETWDLYNSRKCLQEIYTAQFNGIEILRLRFDDDISEEQFAWPCVAKHDVAAMDMVDGLKEHYMLLKPHPSWSCVPRKHDTLQAVASDLKEKFMISRSMKKQSLTSAGVLSRTGAFDYFATLRSDCTSTTRGSDAIVGVPSLPAESISFEASLRTAGDKQRTASAELAKQREKPLLSLPMTKSKSITKTKKTKSNGSASPYLATIGRSDFIHTKSNQSKSIAKSSNSALSSISGDKMRVGATGSHSPSIQISRNGQRLNDIEKTPAVNAEDDTNREGSARLREGQRKKAATHSDSLRFDRIASEPRGQAMAKTKSFKSKRIAQSADRKFKRAYT